MQCTNESRITYQSITNVSFWFGIAIQDRFQITHPIRIVCSLAGKQQYDEDSICDK